MSANRYNLITQGGLTILFEEPFWIGLFEMQDESGLRVCKVTFGAEPTDMEVIEFIQKNHDQLVYSAAVEASSERVSKNPKRMMREARKQTGQTGIGTKSQQALKLQHETAKDERKVRTRQEKEAEKQERFEARQLKKKDKHRGH